MESHSEEKDAFQAFEIRSKASSSKSSRRSSRSSTSVAATHWSALARARAKAEAARAKASYAEKRGSYDEEENRGGSICIVLQSQRKQLQPGGGFNKLGPQTNIRMEI